MLKALRVLWHRFYPEPQSLVGQRSNDKFVETLSQVPNTETTTHSAAQRARERRVGAKEAGIAVRLHALPRNVPNEGLLHVQYLTWSKTRTIVPWLINAVSLYTRRVIDKELLQKKKYKIWNRDGCPALTVDVDRKKKLASWDETFGPFDWFWLPHSENPRSSPLKTNRTARMMQFKILLLYWGLRLSTSNFQNHVLESQLFFFFRKIDSTNSFLTSDSFREVPFSVFQPLIPIDYRCDHEKINSWVRATSCYHCAAEDSRIPKMPFPSPCSSAKSKKWIILHGLSIPNPNFSEFAFLVNRSGD